ncbi:MAG: MerC domain-containing protein [Bacteroidota bacterium]
MIARIFKQRADLAGVIASGLCIIHCILTPVIVVSLPFLSHQHGDHYHGHWAGLDSLFVLLSLIAVFFASRDTHKPGIGIALWLSWAAFAIGIFLHMWHIEVGEIISYIGSFALIITHLVNLRYHKLNPH